MLCLLTLQRGTLATSRVSEGRARDGTKSLVAEVRDAFLQGTGVEDANMPTLNLMVRR